MPISGITVLTAPNSLEAVRDQLEREFKAEIPAIKDNYLTVVLETATSHEMKQKFEAIQRLSGVMSAWVAYHNVEDIPKLKGEQ